MTKCKVCRSQHLADIDRLIISGANFNYLSQWCSDRGFKVTSNTLKRHANKHVADYQPSSKIEHSNLEASSQKSEVEFNIICFEAYCNSIGLKPSDFQDLELNIEKIIYGSQKALSLLFFKNCAIVDFKLTQHLSDRAAYPLEQIRGLRSVFEMYAKVTGIDIMINENAAIKMLESAGYTISKNTIDVPVEK